MMSAFGPLLLLPVVVAVVVVQALVSEARASDSCDWSGR